MDVSGGSGFEADRRRTDPPRFPTSAYLATPHLPVEDEWIVIHVIHPRGSDSTVLVNTFSIVSLLRSQWLHTRDRRT